MLGGSHTLGRKNLLYLVKTVHCWEENRQGHSAGFYGPHDGQVGHVLDPLKAEDVEGLEDGEGGEGTAGGHVDGGPQEEGDGQDTVVGQLAQPEPGEIAREWK